ncbi:MAG: type I-B CRISPR-associated protein Cas7/Csh2 [Halanaerobiales bacterium]|nr:type I-B CRISPR-associated protein Cas7/Csh2 [Halanaerobiales bacterium]
MGNLQQRIEILFLYDIKDANPNGDILNENKPRIDEETGINLVTDVRLKRTVRDYLYEYEGFNGSDDKDIFIREIRTEDNYIQDGKTRAKDFKEDAKTILDTCIDIRLFGGVIPVKGNPITYTGPVQFQMGRSLHPVQIVHIKGTGAFASKAKATQKTFREEYVLPYSLIAFNGIVNENAAKYTQMTEEDFQLLKKAIWFGTKNLISRSKFGQIPRLLLTITYKTPGFFIGELRNYLELKTDMRPEKIRDVSDYQLDVTKLVGLLTKHKEHIENCEAMLDERTQIMYNGEIVKNNSEFKFVR